MANYDSAFDTVLREIAPGTRLKTPDARTCKPFIVEEVTPEGVLVRTFSGGRVRIGLFAFDGAVKVLADLGIRGGTWLPVKDDLLQAVLNAENDRVRASSYVIAILGAAGLIDVDGGRPNKVRLAG